jgi:pimeloyl-ACP methyl ester carboxylesterase
MTGHVVRRAVNGIELDVVEAGDPDGPAVVLCHGFPESAHSWRHQLAPLADAGYHVLAPDQRGYARSSAPRDVEAYGIEHLAGDLTGLLDETGHDDAVFVGHDWGALAVWDLARLRPERVRAVVNASVPYTPWPAPPTELMRAQSGDRFFYILYFQPVGPAERELEADVERTMRSILWIGSGAGYPDDPPEPPPAEGHGFLDAMEALGPVPAELPRWLTEEDVAAYVDAFEASGFFGPISWYRNLDANHERVKELPPPPMPVWFIAGRRDMVIAARPGYVESMAATLPDYRGATLIDGAGHWVQQEAPAEFNRALLEALTSLD